MYGRHQQVWLNGMDLASVHPSILLQHINEGELKLAQRWNDRPGGGQMLLSNQFQQKEILIEFAIRDGRDYDRRLEAFTAVCQWAVPGGWLEISSRPGQRIYVTLSQLPTIGRLREWTETMSVHFMAGWYPFWEDITPMTASASGSKTGTISIVAPGTAQSTLDAVIGSGVKSVILANDATGTEIQISRTQAFSDGITIDHDERHLMRIMSGSAAIMKYRTGSDEIILNPGVNTIRYTLDTEAVVHLTAKGAWL